MPRRRKNGLDHARVGRQAQDATVRGLVAGAVAEAHAAHPAALHDPAGSVRTFFGGATLPAISALNGAGAPALLLAMNRS